MKAFMQARGHRFSCIINFSHFLVPLHCVLMQCSLWLRADISPGRRRAIPGRAHLRSADSGQYDVPRVSTLAGPRAFLVAGPLVWNQLPASLRNMNCIATFKRHLKTIQFKAAYGVANN